MNKFLEDHKPKLPKRKLENPKPPTNGFEAIAGRYHDAAYGVIELHPLITARNAGEPAWSFTTEFDKIFCKELLFEHSDGDIFNVTAKITFETGAVIWDMTGQGIRAYFGEGGMGLQHIWGEGLPDGNMKRDGIRQGSEVFFVKVS